MIETVISVILAAWIGLGLLFACRFAKEKEPRYTVGQKVAFFLMAVFLWPIALVLGGTD